MRSHVRAPPTTDELAELKGENPEAYALVKALLTKRSLGLLDPRHPTAKFAGAEQQHPQTAEQGPDAFSQFASRGTQEGHSSHQEAQTSKASVPYAEVKGTAHQDWLNWKPQNTAADDDTMVQNVLGAVAELKGKKITLMSKHRASASPTAAEKESSEATSQPAMAAPQDSKPSTPTEHKNSYLDGLDLSGDMPQITEGNKKAKQTGQDPSSSTNPLASFSWDDSQPPVQDRPHPQREAALPVNSKDANLLSWLGVKMGVVNKAPAHQTVPVASAAPAKPSNPYLADLA